MVTVREIASGLRILIFTLKLKIVHSTTRVIESGNRGISFIMRELNYIMLVMD